MFSFVSSLLPALNYGPELFHDAEQVFSDLAHGEGGIEKIETALHSLVKLIEDAAAAAVAVGVPGVSSTLGSSIASIAQRVELDVNSVIAMLAPAAKVVEPTGPASLQPGNTVVGASGAVVSAGDPGYTNNGTTGAT